MRINALLIFAFIICICTSAISQEIDSLHQSTNPKVTVETWHTSPSLRWNATAAINFWVPAVSLVFEYPFNKRLGLEVEGGPILPFADMLFEGEKFKGFRARIGPKLYFFDEDADLFYLRLLFKYDRTKSLRFKPLLDPSQSFQEEKLTEERFENIGGILYAGYLVSFLKNRLVLDLSLGLGYTSWDERIDIPDGNLRLDDGAQFFGFRTRPSGSIPVFSFNLQFGYFFHGS